MAYYPVRSIQEALWKLTDLSTDAGVSDLGKAYWAPKYNCSWTVCDLRWWLSRRVIRLGRGTVFIGTAMLR